MPTARKASPRPTSRQTKLVLGPEGAATPPAFRPVQLATLVDAVPEGDRWIHEMKYDGYRILVAVGGGEARAYTRSGLDWSDRFPSILSEASKLKVGSALIDGEAVVCRRRRPIEFSGTAGRSQGSSQEHRLFRVRSARARWGGFNRSLPARPESEAKGDPANE
jgi:bifunctional non-homologous end joining protein LigD